MINLFTLAKHALSHKPHAPRFELHHPTSFYRVMRDLTGSLTQRQVDTTNGLLKACRDWPLPWAAYALATAWHEALLEPRREWGRGLGKPYGKPTQYGGQRAYGRGLVQTTWARNYEWLDGEAAKAGLIERGELLANFDLALRPDIATLALKRGLETGAYNPKGKGIAHYIPTKNATREHYRAARTLVNLNDKADLIAGHALHFARALHAGGWK